MNTINILNSEDELAHHVSAVSTLYKVVIPHAAKLLDSFCELPFDSLTLTNFLHSHGIGCRHIGIVYQLTVTIPVKQLLLIEAVARSFKTLLNRSLRNLARQMKSKTEVFRLSL